MDHAIPPSAEGEALRDAALDRVETLRPRLVLRARREFIRYLLTNGEGAVEAIRPAVPVPPNVSPKFFGAVPRAFAEDRIIERARYANAARPLAHARPVAVWKLIDAAAALAWLKANPMPADAPSGAGRESL